MALNLGGIGVTHKIAEHIILTYEKLLEKGSDFSVKDAWFVEVFAKFAALAIRHNYNPIECLEQAYNEIKNRTGKIINNEFVKD